MKTSTTQQEASKSVVLEALFTPEWAAVYDPVTRNRWETTALLDEEVFKSLCSDSLNGSSLDQREQLLAAEIATVHDYDLDDAQGWIEAGWTDALRHYLHTNYLPKLSYASADGWAEDFSTMKDKVKQSPLPEPTKQYGRAIQRIPAAASNHARSLRDVLEMNPRNRGQRSVDYPALANLLMRVFGVTGHKTLAVTGTHVTKTSPSGGSRHPTEAYVIVFDIQGMDKGVYHFDSARHEVVQIRSADLKSEYMEHVFGLNRRIAFQPRAAILLTSIVERSMHRYRDSRSYRVIHFDIGHLLLSCQLVARAEGLIYFSSYSVAEEAAEKMVGIDGLFETAVSQLLLG